MAVIVVIYILLGCLMDSLSMILLTIPIFFPVVMGLDFGLSPEHTAIWFGILALIVVELGLIHPPVGLNVYVIQNIAGDVSMLETFKGVVPFLIAEFFRVSLDHRLPGSNTSPGALTRPALRSPPLPDPADPEFVIVHTLPSDDSLPWSRFSPSNEERPNEAGCTRHDPAMPSHRFATLDAAQTGCRSAPPGAAEVGTAALRSQPLRRRQRFDNNPQASGTRGLAMHPGTAHSRRRSGFCQAFLTISRTLRGGP